MCVCVGGCHCVIQEEVTMLAQLRHVGSLIRYEAEEMPSNICIFSSVKLISPI